MEIEKVTINDLDDIVNIELKFFDGVQFYSKKSLEEMLANDNVIFIKVVDKKIIKGYSLAYYLTDHIDLYQIAVDHKYQRHHIATKLHQELNKRMLPIYVEVAENNEAAIAFYEANGYNIIKILSNYYGFNSNALLMRKE